MTYTFSFGQMLASVSARVMRELIVTSGSLEALLEPFAVTSGLLHCYILTHYVPTDVLYKQLPVRLIDYDYWSSAWVLLSPA